MRLLLLSLLLSSAATAAGRAQSYEELAMRYSEPRAYHEAVVLPARERAAVFVSFRIPNRMLVFVRDRGETPGRAFLAEPRVVVQFFRDGQQVDRQVWQQPHSAATFEETQQEAVDLQGMVRFDLAPGAYTYRLWLQDRQAEREGRSEPRPVTVPDFRARRLGPAVLAGRVEAGPEGVRFDLVNLGGDAPYGRDAQAVLPVALPEGLHAGDAALRYVLRRLDDPDADVAKGPVVAEGEVEAGAWIALSGEPEALPGEGALRWPPADAPAASPRFLVPVALHGAALADGAYLLEATLAAGADSTQEACRFDTHWRMMPYSLYHPEAAIDNLRFVENRATLKALRRGSREEQEQHIRAYWAARDPTPDTPFNELMDEYYRRVDQAAFAFRTGLASTPDGLRTDRAAVYVVHGPPEKVERTFPSGGGVEETWIYADGRRFVFRAATSLDPLELQRD